MAHSSTSTTEEQAELAKDYVSAVFGELGRSSLTIGNAKRWHERGTMMANTFDAFRAKTAQYVRDCKSYEFEHYTSAVAYVAHKDGVSLGDARALIEMQDGLDNFPRLQEIFDIGLLSLQKVQAVVEGATLEPEAFDDLLECAHRDTLATLQAEVRRIQASLDPEPESEAKKKARLRFRNAGPFLNHLFGTFTNEQRAIIEAKVEPETERVFREMSKAGTFESLDNCRAIALVNVLCNAGNGKEPRPHFLIALDLTLVQSGEKTLDEVCNIPGIGPVEKGILLRLLSDAYVDFDLRGTDEPEDDSELLDPEDVVDEAPTPTRRRGKKKYKRPRKKNHSGHRSSPGYEISERIRRKLRANGGHVCAMRGCDNRVGLDCDHNFEWRDGGITCECNLEFLCRRHHQMKTQQRLMLDGPRNSRVFVPMRAGPCSRKPALRGIDESHR